MPLEELRLPIRAWVATITPVEGLARVADQCVARAMHRRMGFGMKDNT
jgi:hypothetical protein